MWPRRQLPVYSPVSAGAVLGGLRAALRPRDESAPRALEDVLARRYSGSAVLLVDSGTSALTLALAGAIAGKSDARVALPAYSCYDLATAAVGARANVLLYDLDPHTLGPDFESLRAALAAGARIVVVAYLYGVPADLDEIQRLCDSHGALIIEDAAQGAGGRWRDRILGSWGSLSILSFGRGKGMTGGGGGALVAHGAAGDQIIARVRGRLEPATGLWPAISTAAQWMLARPAWYGVPSSLPFLNLGETVYHEPTPPTRIPAVCAAVVLRTMPLADREVAVRRRNAARVSAALAKNTGVETVKSPGQGEPGYLRLPVIAGAAAVTALASERARALAIMPGYPRALPELEQMRATWSNPGTEFPGAQRLARHLFTIPTHGLLAERDLAALESFILSG